MSGHCDDLDEAGAAEMLILLAYGVNLRSRSGAGPTDLKSGVEATLHALAWDCPVVS